MPDNKRWIVQDRYGHEIYLTVERWNHIVDPEHHPGMSGYEMQLQETIQSGRRTQDSLVPNKYYYRKAFDDLPDGNTHIIAVVLFKLNIDEAGNTIENNFIVTAYQNFIN